MLHAKIQDADVLANLRANPQITVFCGGGDKWRFHVMRNGRCHTTYFTAPTEHPLLQYASTFNARIGSGESGLHCDTHVGWIFQFQHQDKKNHRLYSWSRCFGLDVEWMALSLLDMATADAEEVYREMFEWRNDQMNVEDNLLCAV